jgi:hypothetical protein
MNEYLLETELEMIVDRVNAVAGKCGDDSDRLLALLRTLEGLHRRICAEQFEPSLPNTRKDLYALLKDMEESGGWPYIERGKLQTVMQSLIKEDSSGTESTPEKSINENSP